MADDAKFDVCAYCSTPTWTHSSAKGPMCPACRIERFFERVLYQPKGLSLLAWQRKFLREVYGSVDVETGRRRYWQAYCEVPKKNGKSFLVGGLPLYHLMMERIDRHEAYGCASAKDQAAIVFRSAAHLVKGNALLENDLKLLESTKRIVRRDGRGFYAVLSADGDLQDGIEPSLAIIDELHRWKTAKANTLHDVVTKGGISRPDPLCVKITTAGSQEDSPLWWRDRQRAERVLAGQPDKRFYATIYRADPERVAKDPEYARSREARVAANPSHEDNGGFLQDDKIGEEMTSGTWAAYLRYHLNIPGQRDERWLKSGEWERGSVSLRPLLGRPCWAGLDLSSTTDFSALVLAFPSELDGSYDLLPFCWVPDGRVAELSRALHVPLEEWIRAGLVLTTPGDAVDYSAIEKKLRWAQEDFSLQEVCYDPWNAHDLIGRLENEGYRCVKVPQTMNYITGPTKHLHRKIIEGKVRHGGHEVFAWMMNAAVTRGDSNGNIMLKKPDLGRDSFRIDLAAATVTALQRGMIPEGSIYETRGVLVV